MVETISIMAGLSTQSSGWIGIVGLGSLKGAMVLLVAFAAAGLARRASAAGRYLIWASAFVALAALPAAALIAPSWDWAVLPGQERQSLRPQPASPRPAISPQASTVPEAASVTVPLLVAPPTAFPGRIPSSAKIPTAGLDVWQSAAAVWLVGTALLTLRWLAALLSITRRRKAACPAQAPLQALCDRLAKQIGLRRSVCLLIGSEAQMPVAWGVFYPTVLLPAEVSEWRRGRLEAVLLHELAHLRRGDLPVQHLCSLACALHWPNPLVWAAARRLRRERERACDDLVLAGGARPSEYAKQLLILARSFRSPRSSSVGLAMARPSQLEGRLMAILDKARRRGDFSVGRLVLLAALALTLTAPLAALRFSPAAAGASGGRSGHLTHRDDSGRLEIWMTNVRIDDGYQLQSIEPDGRLRIDWESDRRMVLEVLGQADGTLSRSFSVDGRTVDAQSAEAERLLAKALDFLRGLDGEQAQLRVEETQARLEAATAAQQLRELEQAELRRQAAGFEREQKQVSLQAEEMRAQIEQESEQREEQNTQEAERRFAELQRTFESLIRQQETYDRAHIRQLQRRMDHLGQELDRFNRDQISELSAQLERILASVEKNGGQTRHTIEQLEEMSRQLQSVLRHQRGEKSEQIEGLKHELDQSLSNMNSRLEQVREQVEDLLRRGREVGANEEQIDQATEEFMKRLQSLTAIQSDLGADTMRRIATLNARLAAKSDEIAARTEQAMDQVRKAAMDLSDARTKVHPRIVEEIVAAVGRAGYKLNSLNRSRFGLALDEFVDLLLRQGTLRIDDETARFQAPRRRVFDHMNVFVRDFIAGFEVNGQADSDQRLEQELQGLADSLSNLEIKLN